MMQAYQPDPRHTALGDGFYDVVRPADFPQEVLRFRNRRWAERVGLGSLSDAAWAAHFARFVPLPDNLPEPLALRYHGHQFTTYNPDLGDGRGFLFAQLRDPVDGRLLDLGTKGSGRTPWSRTADGRLTLKGGVREVLATEMLEALGTDTSKSFSLIETGEALQRNDEPSPTRASVLVRLSHSHIRIGTFQRFAYHQDTERLQRLTDHVVRTYMADLWDADPAARAAAMLARAVGSVASLAAGWTAAGFVHGVLNTDNINITGESFDYGPYRFLPHYDPGFTAAYFDQRGLYAFARQPTMVKWNLDRLAECLLPLADEAALVAALDGFGPAFDTALRGEMLRRLALRPRGDAADQALLSAIFRFLADSRIGYERFFFDWRGGMASRDRAAAGPDAAHYDADGFAPLRALLAGYEPAADLRLDDPYFAAPGPCTLLIDEIEAIWQPIADADDWSSFEAKLRQIAGLRRIYGREAGMGG